MESIVPFIVINGLFSSFFLVRVIKGAWMRNPQYLAVAMVGAVGAMLSLNAMEPGMADGFIAGNLAAFAGAFGAITLYDLALGSA